VASRLGARLMPPETITVQVRFRPAVKRAVDELTDLELLGRSREQVIQVLIMEGLRAVYDRLGITPDPAAMARNLLEAVAANWDEVMSDDEIDAIEVTRKALERIAQVRTREG